MLLLAGSIGLWFKRQPWKLQCELPHGATVFDAAFSSDGMLLATGDAGGFLRIWDISAGHEIRKIDTGKIFVLKVLFTPDGKQVVAAHRDVTVFDVATGRQIWRAGPRASLDRQTSQEIRLETQNAFSTVQRLTLTPSGKCLFLYHESSAFVWTLFSNQISELKPPRHSGGILRLQGTLWNAAISEDGRYVVTASEDGVSLWDGENVVSHKASPVYAVAITRDGQLFAAGGNDGSISIWHRESGRQIQTLTGGHAKFLADLDFSPDGEWLLSTSDAESKAVMWDVKSGAKLSEYASTTSKVYSSCFSSDGNRVLSFGDRATVWHPPTGEILSEFPRHGTNPLRAAKFSDDGQRVVTCGDDKLARVWARVREEPWWGYFLLPEGWVALACGSFLSVRALQRFVARRSAA